LIVMNHTVQMYCHVHSTFFYGKHAYNSLYVQH